MLNIFRRRRGMPSVTNFGGLASAHNACQGRWDLADGFLVGMGEGGEQPRSGASHPTKVARIYQEGASYAAVRSWIIPSVCRHAKVSSGVGGQGTVMIVIMTEFVEDAERVSSRPIGVSETAGGRVANSALESRWPSWPGPCSPLRRTRS